MLNKLDIKYVLITGDETLTEKQQNMDAFNQDETVRVALCNRRAAGIGVNLVAASHSITYSRNFSLTEELQSGDRNYRGGSQIHDEIVKIDLCAKDTIDEVVTQALCDKQEVSNRVIDLVRQRRNNV